MIKNVWSHFAIFFNINMFGHQTMFGLVRIWSPNISCLDRASSYTCAYACVANEDQALLYWQYFVTYFVARRDQGRKIKWRRKTKTRRFQWRRRRRPRRPRGRRRKRRLRTWKLVLYTQLKSFFPDSFGIFLGFFRGYYFQIFNSRYPGSQLTPVLMRHRGDEAWFSLHSLSVWVQL